jgi:uncharacterized protein (TIGR03435 family)
MTHRTLLTVVAAGLAFAAPISAQQVTLPLPPAADIAPGDTAPVSFEVATVKLNKSGAPFVLININAGRFTASNFPLRELIRVVFRLQPNQLVGGPDWLTDRYDITGKIPEGVAPARRDDMVKALLADRFKLVTHTETRELPLFALVLARRDGRLGPSLSLTKNDCTPGRGRGAALAGGGPPPGGMPPPPPAFKPGERPTCGTMQGPGLITAGGITMTRLSELLSGNVGRTVIDRTGLAGPYDLDITYTPDPGQGLPPGPLPPGVQAPNIDPNGPPLVTAIQEQLGLKLDAIRGPVVVTVIDRIERPTED